MGKSCLAVTLLLCLSGAGCARSPLFVAYRVAGSGSHSTADIFYTDDKNHMVREHNVRLPWRKEFSVTPGITLLINVKGASPSDSYSTRILVGADRSSARTVREEKSVGSLPVSCQVVVRAPA